MLNVDVESGAAGENPVGTVSWQDLGLTPGGTAYSETRGTCLSVSGRVAIVGVTGSRETFGATPRQMPVAGLVRIVDSGGQDAGADRFEFAIQTGPENGPPLPGPTTCSAFPGPFPTGDFRFPSFTNETGNVIVTDVRPLPTTKDQCKNGGWRSFGVFKNQGNCVSFIATGGKNRPAGSTTP